MRFLGVYRQSVQLAADFEETALKMAAVVGSEQTAIEVREATEEARGSLVDSPLDVLRRRLTRATLGGPGYSRAAGAEAIVTHVRELLDAAPEQVGAFTILWCPRGGPTDTPLGDVEIEPVRLDECWRCSVTIPKEDPLGLCDPCRIQLRDL